MARPAEQLRSVHDLLQPFRSLATRGRLGEDYERARRGPRRRRADDRHIHCARASTRCLRHAEQKTIDGPFARWVDQQNPRGGRYDGLPVRVALTAGEAHDNRLAGRLLSRLQSGAMLLADRGYDADWIRTLAAEKGAWANIPPRCNRNDPICFSPHLYRARNLVERFFNKIKHCRRVATRYDKLAANYLAFVQLASIRLWLRANESTS